VKPVYAYSNRRMPPKSFYTSQLICLLQRRLAFIRLTFFPTKEELEHIKETMELVEAESKNISNVYMK